MAAHYLFQSKVHQWHAATAGCCAGTRHTGHLTTSLLSALKEYRQMCVDVHVRTSLSAARFNHPPASSLMANSMA